MNKETVTDALDQLRAQGEVYFRADDLAEYLDVEVTQGKKSHISAILNDIEGVEKWGRSKCITWRINSGETA